MPRSPISTRDVAAATERAKQTARDAAANPWVERLARFGYAAKGVVYIIIGVLAVQAAWEGGSGELTGSRGALRTIAEQPFGQILLGIVAIGLAGYALWRFVQAFVDPEHKGTDAKGIVTRIGYAVSGVIHTGLAISAVGLIQGSGGGGSGNSSREWTARLLAAPFGALLVGLVGAIIIGFGCTQFYKAYTAKFRRKFITSEMSRTEETWATRLGRLGFAARGVVFVLVGVFFIFAAVQSDPNEARGLDGALQTLAEQPFGPWLLGIVALGLIAYGVFMFVEARYRRIYLRR